MTELEDLKTALISKEVNYRRQVGRPPMHQLRKGVLESIHPVPPKLRYTLSDSNQLNGVISLYEANSYNIVDSSGNIESIADNDWDVYLIRFQNYQAIGEEKSFFGKGSLFGDAILLFQSITFEVKGYFKAPDEYSASDNVYTDMFGSIPEDTVYVFASVYRPGLKQNLQFTVCDFQEFDVTDFVHSDTEFVIKQLRDSTSGVTREGANSLILTGIAKQFLESAFLMYKFRTNIAYKVYLRALSGREYTQVKKEVLDFQSAIFTDATADIPARNQGLTELLKSNGKTKYDIPVSEIKTTKQWLYDRVILENRGNFEMPTGEEYGVGGNNNELVQPYVYFVSAEMTPETAEHEFKNQSSGVFDANNCFMISDSSVQPSIIINLTARWDIVSGTKYDYERYFLLVKNGDTANPLLKLPYEYKGQEETVVGGTSQIVQMFQAVVNQTVSLNDPLLEGDKLSICIQSVTSDNGGRLGEHFISEFKELTVVYTSQGRELILDVISPLTLANTLLNKITGIANKYVCTINWGDLSYVPMLCAAETLRGFSNAVYHGSMNDFMDWMKVMGFEYTVDEGSVTFAPRNSFYQKDVTTLELGRGRIADFEMAASENFGYTSVQVGYDKQDYESANGRFEANGTFEYSTRFVDSTENSLNLISPYRADAVGLELLCWERKNNTSDTSSDNDVFVVAMKDAGSYYMVYDEVTYTPLESYEGSNIKLFNAVLNPYYLTKRNESLIGISADKLIFASTTSNRSVSLSNGQNVFEDVSITTKLFEPFVYRFTVGYLFDLPNQYNWNGLVKFRHKDKLYQGYILSIEKDYYTNSALEWELYAVLE